MSKNNLKEELSSSDSSSSDSENEKFWDPNYQQEEEDSDIEEIDLICPFSLDLNTKFTQLETLFKHLKEKHNLDLLTLSQDWKLDFYSKIKLINFIRSRVKNDPKIHLFEELKILSNQDSIFTQEIYLKPTLEDDQLLTFLMDDEFNQENNKEKKEKKLKDQKSNNNNNNNKTKIQQLEEKIKQLERENKEIQERLSTHIQWTNETFLADQPQQVPPSLDEKNPKTTTVLYSDPNLFQKDEHGYFETYSSYHIHEVMLKDKIRTNAYQDFILKNEQIFKDKIVLDIGCGTGILSMFAAKAGAKLVIGIDNSGIIQKAREHISLNNLQDQIILVQGKAEKVDLLPILQKYNSTNVDIIISEWMGYFLLFESMLDTIIVLREKWLSPIGKVFPNQTDILFCACELSDFRKDKIEYWNNPYGFDLRPMKEMVYKEPLVTVIDEKEVISNIFTLKKIDISKESVQSVEFSNTFELIVSKDCSLGGFLGYFDTSFFDYNVKGKRNDIPIHFSTGPFTKKTHWKQTLFLIKETSLLSKGEIITGKMSVSRNRDHHRSLDIQLSWIVKDKSYSQFYVLN